MKPTPLTTMAELIERYDVFLIDQFGVLRDNNGLYEGASQALKTLKAADKVVVILSNSGKDGDGNARRLVDLGIERASFDRFVTSGDVGFSILKRPGSPAKPGGRCLTIASADAPGFAEILGMMPADTGCDADLVLIAGSEAERIPMEEYASLLRRAAERDVACFCTNPDLRKLWKGTSVPGAGSIADLYEALGGQVTRLGKPFQEIYDTRSDCAMVPRRAVSSAWATASSTTFSAHGAQDFPPCSSRRALPPGKRRKPKRAIWRGSMRGRPIA